MMFLSGELGQKAFAWRVGVAVVLYLLATTFGPLLLLATSCGKSDGACISGIGFWLWSPPVIYLIFVLACVAFILKRLRNLHLPTLLVAIPVVFFLADVQRAAALSFQLSAFIMKSGSLYSFILPHALLGLLCMLLLCMIPNRDRSDMNLLDRWGLLGIMTFGMLVLMAVGAAFEALRTMSILLPGINAYQAMSTFMRYYAFYGNIIVILIFVLLTARYVAHSASD